MNNSYSDVHGNIFHTVSTDDRNVFVVELAAGGTKIKERYGDIRGYSLAINAGTKYAALTGTT